MNLARKNDTLDAKIARMSEFFFDDDIWDMKDACINEGYNFESYMTFLDKRVRDNHYSSYGRCRHNPFRYFMLYMRTQDG